MSTLEICANAFNTTSIILAGRNSLHTWWTGIVGCALFALLFVQTQLYADATLQLFFIVTSGIGLWRWRSGGEGGSELPIGRASRRSLLVATSAALVLTVVYGLLLARFTDAFAPMPDSFVLAFSVAAQLLLMRRLVESWWFWLAVNSVAVPLYLSRALYLTAGLYVLFWFNAVFALWGWHKQASAP